MINKKILVVDDDSKARKRNIDILNEIEGIDVLQASSLSEAMKVVAKSSLFGAILDVNLNRNDPTNQDGFKLLNYLWENTKIAWVLLCTGSTSISRYELDQYRPIRIDYVDKREQTASSLRKRIIALYEGRSVRGVLHPLLRMPAKASNPEVGTGKGRLLIIENDIKWMDKIGAAAASVQLEPVSAKNSKEAIGALNNERFRAVTLDKNLFEPESRHRHDYDELHMLLSLIEQRSIPCFIVTKYEDDGLDESLYQRYHCLKRILFKDERAITRLKQALQAHAIDEASPLPDHHDLYKAVQSVLHYRYLKNDGLAVSKLEKTEPIKRLANSVRLSPRNVVGPLRQVTLEMFTEQTHRAEQDELALMLMPQRIRLQNDMKDSLTEFVLSSIEAKCIREPKISEWPHPYWLKGTLMSEFWPPKVDRFTWWLFMNALYGPYNRKRMQVALETLFTVGGRSFFDLRDPALNELVDEVEEHAGDWLKPAF
jgi:CheY-like chemotaxis protein